METLQSLDLDGLDGILSSPAKQQSRSVRSKAILALLLIVLAMIILFFPLKHPPSPLTSPEAATPPTAKVVAEAAKILPQTAAAQSSVKDEQVTPAPADTSSMPRAGAISASAAQPQQDSAVQSPMAQAQPDLPVLPAEPTAAGNATDTVGGSLFTVYFKFKSSAPVRLSEAETSRLMATARSCPKRIRITGHTCHLGGVEANFRLGQIRANAVKKLLVANGIAEGQIETASEGENMPATSNATASGQAANRRAVLDCVNQ